MGSVLGFGLLAVLVGCTGGAEDTASDTEVQDTGTPVETLRDWFADYDADAGLDYLEEEGERYADGDPSREGLPDHVHHHAMPYGPHARNLVDVWVPADPQGVLLYFHGGGFVSGSREDVSSSAVAALLDAGVAVASADYRYGWADGEAAVREGAPQDEGSDPEADGARLDYILRDCARVVQYLRYREDVGLSALPVVTMGSSAGGGCAVWTGGVEDLAVDGHVDPVLRESTRVQGMVHLTSQATYDFSQWSALLDVPVEEMEALLGGLPEGLTQQDEDATWSPGALNSVLDFAGLLDAGDPPLWSENDQAYPEDIDDSSTLLHTPVGHEALYQRCVDQGGDCTLRTVERSDGREGDVWDFVLDVFGAD